MARKQAVRVGNLVAVARTDRPGLNGLADRLQSRGYRRRETPHFLVCQQPPGNGLTVVMHTFNERTVDENIASIVADELGPLGAITSLKEYGDAIFAVVASTCPSSLYCSECGRLHLDNPAIWRHFCINTLTRLQTMLAACPSMVASPTSHIEQFAAVYQRIIEYRVGDSLLDVASNLGLLPVLLAEGAPGIRVVGCDSRQEAVSSAADLAVTTGNRHVTFLVKDVLAPNFGELGLFDTVTSVHLLEHLPEDDLSAALTNMLRVTARRLIIAVPYEATMQPLYGHQQTFTAEKLRHWGSWCIETLGGGRFWCEHVSGGLLVVDRPPAGPTIWRA